MITTQKELRKLFWETHPTASRKKIPSQESCGGVMYTTDTRCAFVFFLDRLYRDGQISESLADRATL